MPTVLPKACGPATRPAVAPLGARESAATGHSPCKTRRRMAMKGARRWGAIRRFAASSRAGPFSVRRAFGPGTARPPATPKKPTWRRDTSGFEPSRAERTEPRSRGRAPRVAGSAVLSRAERSKECLLGPSDTLVCAAPGDVAQLGERRVRNAKVGSSILLVSTRFVNPALGAHGAPAILPGGEPIGGSSFRR